MENHFVIKGYPNTRIYKLAEEVINVGGDPTSLQKEIHRVDTEKEAQEYIQKKSSCH